MEGAMSTWLYQLNPTIWPPERYRLEIWEGERWSWSVGRKVTGGRSPKAGDVVVFFSTPSGGTDAGFYGWAVILEWYQEGEEMYFRPVTPSDQMKMHPWWNKEAQTIANEIRGRVKQGTFWYVDDNHAMKIRKRSGGPPPVD
jgi:hypothetical protein